MNYLLDTCILSKLRKIRQQPNKSLEKWIMNHDEAHYFISALTLGEIQAGITKLDEKTTQTKQSKRIFKTWLFEELISRFEGRILPIDVEVTIRWGELQAKGGPLPVIDSLLAATALVHHLTLVTENIKDFQYAGLEVFNPC